MTVALNSETFVMHQMDCEWGASTKTEALLFCDSEIEGFDKGFKPCRFCFSLKRGSAQQRRVARSKKFAQLVADEFLGAR